MTRLTIICLTSIVFSFGHKVCGQIDNSMMFDDSSKLISKQSYENLVNNCITLLETKEVADIPDSSQINIMMCLNTIFVQQFKDLSSEKLLSVANEKKYSQKILKIYPDWTPNRGMGYYFPRLKMELYGTPRKNSIFKIIK